MKGRADYLDLGNWNAVCFECGRKFKASQLVRHWQGYYVCQRCFEPRQPQDFVKGIPDVQVPPWVQPPPANTFRSIVDFITVENAATDNPFIYAIATELSIPLTTE